MQFITRTRIESACDDLLTTKKKLTLIAKDNGFYDQSSFTQLQEANEALSEIQEAKGIFLILNSFRKYSNPSNILQNFAQQDPTNILDPFYHQGGINPSSNAANAVEPSEVNTRTITSITSEKSEGVFLWIIVIFGMVCGFVNITII